MSDTARDYKVIDPASTKGLEDFFDPVSTEATQVLPSEGLPCEHPGHPVEEAAKILGVSARTVIKRLRKGTLPGFKIHDKFGEKWVVSTEALLGDPQVLPQATLGQPQVLPGEVSPQSTQFLPVDRLFDIMEKQAHELQGAHWRNGHLETRVHDLEALVFKQEEQLKLLTDSQHKASLWRRFYSWFIGR
jgi:excisionase family DNA binding protein